jgi:hypothetical protein
MRRHLVILSGLCALAAPGLAFAQYGGGAGGPGGMGGPGAPGGYGGTTNAPGVPGSDDDQKKKDEWNLPQGILPDVNAAGPCPYVKVLYDAARYEEFQGGREAAAAVAYTGEVQNLRAMCTYKADDPIRVKLNVLFELGRGPAAQGDTKTYKYWVAVTLRNQGVIEKQWFDMPVKFSGSEDRVYQREELDDIVIPRKDKSVSGNNFEILIGFEVTPEMADFNREGKRFRITAAGQTAAASDTGGQTKSQ